LCWTVRPDAVGVWRPDWSDTEPDPIPVPTVAWLTWHITWWWSTTLDRVTGEIPRDRDGVVWPGDGAVAVSEVRDLLRDGERFLPNSTPSMSARRCG